jgi:alkylhydroperoxidase/carboxymuconolactone decarboxylase family protein YurZ
MMSTTVHGLTAVIRRQQPMDDAQADRAAFGTAERLLEAPLVLPMGPGEPPSGADFRRLATRHTFGDSWTRTGLDVRSRALISMTIAATLGAREPLRGQPRIALSNGVNDEIVDLFIHLEAYSGASGGARAERQPGRTRAARRLGAAALLPPREPGERYQPARATLRAA